MTNKQRTDLIEQFIRDRKYADLRTLATEFGGSLSTVRRALDQLEARGIVRRHHGGASFVETDALAQESDFTARDQRHPDEKFAIANIVADLVKPGQTVILDGGSTTYAVPPPRRQTPPSYHQLVAHRLALRRNRQHRDDRDRWQHL